MPPPIFSPENTRDGYLPPWEVAKAAAYHVALADIAKHLDTPLAELLGEREDAYIAKKLQLKGGGQPSERAVRAMLVRVQDRDWYPGKPQETSGGRPALYTDHAKEEVARVAMDLKRQLVAPTPRRVRARLPARARHPETSRPMSDKTIHGIFASRCYDECEDDPWQFLESPSQDMLPAALKPLRVACAKHILETMGPGAWYHQVAIDPCSSLLPRTRARQEEQLVAAMGKSKWMSPGSARKGSNLRAPATAKTQASSGQVLQVHWTPVFARGKLRIHICDPALVGPEFPAKLNDSQNLAKFIRHVLGDILEEMRSKYKWPNLPRTVVHDKASYMVTPAHERVQITFADALAQAGFGSWTGSASASTKWLVAKWGDVYLHETVIAHIRRLLATDFDFSGLEESVAHFKQRMKQVEDAVNAPGFAWKGGRGLEGLARDLRTRCEQVVQRRGERLPK